MVVDGIDYLIHDGVPPEASYKKASFYDTFVKQFERHKVRLIFTDEPRRHIGEVSNQTQLERYLNFVQMEEDVTTGR